MSKPTLDKEAKVRMPGEWYRQLEDEADNTKPNKVSVGQVIRLAIHRYLRNKPAKPARPARKN